MTAGSTNIWQYAGWDDLNNFSFRVNDEQFTAVKVMYFDDKLNNITDSMMSSNTSKQVDVGSSETIYLRLPNSSMDSVVNFYWTGTTIQAISGKYFSELNTGMTSPAFGTSSAAPVTVYMDLSSLDSRYDAINSSIPLSSFTQADKAQADADKELNISFTSPVTDLKPGAAVNFTISMTSGTFNLGDVRAYRVVIDKLGVDTIISALDDEFDSTDTGYEPAYIGTENLQITAADVKLEAIDALEVTGVSISGNKAIISFNRDVTVTGGKSAVSVTGNAAGQVATAVANAGAQTVTVTLNPGHVFGENDTITINNGTGKISDSYGYEIAAGTVAQ